MNYSFLDYSTELYTGEEPAYKDKCKELIFKKVVEEGIYINEESYYGYKRIIDKNVDYFNRLVLLKGDNVVGVVLYIIDDDELDIATFAIEDIVGSKGRLFFTHVFFNVMFPDTEAFFVWYDNDMLSSISEQIIHSRYEGVKKLYIITGSGKERVKKIMEEKYGFIN